MRPKKSDRLFFLIIPIWIFTLCFIGFSPSFYLRSSSLPELKTFMQVHGMITSFWIILFIVQSALLNTKKYKNLHFKLGWVGLAVLFATFVSGLFVTFLAGEMLNKSMASIGDGFIHFIIVFLLGIAGIYFRKKPILHKRLMIFSLMILSSAGISRIVFDFNVGGTFLVYYSIVFLPMLAIFIYDLIVYKKTFKVTMVSGVFIYIFLFYSHYLWQTELWANIVNFINA
ncbi:hypothetical protein [Leptobacterium sp. I13]|uniref:hypothetical protein n=1 Tax=Leptobacterium meishanense TaxID=3128904 RepID=UPI0030EE1B94